MADGWLQVAAVASVGTIAYLAASVSCNNIAGGANVPAAKRQLQTLAELIDLYRLDTGAYPSSQAGLRALLTPPDYLANAGAWKGPYVKGDVLPTDPWGAPYDYKLLNERSYRVRSLGADGKPNTPDDVTN